MVMAMPWLRCCLGCCYRCTCSTLLPPLKAAEEVAAKEEERVPLEARGEMGGSFFGLGSGLGSYSGTDEDASSSDSALEFGSHGEVGLLVIVLFSVLLMTCCCFYICSRCIDAETAVLNVAMFGGKGRSSIQGDLTRIAQAADTSSREGVSKLLRETILALLKQPGCCIAGFSSVHQKWSWEEGEKCFNQLSNEERVKFDKETLVNLNNKISTRSQSVNIVLEVKENTKEGHNFEEKKHLNGFGNDYIVITILVAAKGAHWLPNINGAEDLKVALQKFRSVSSHELLAVDVLWTPQIEGDTLSEERELIKKYPQLAKGLKSCLKKQMID